MRQLKDWGLIASLCASFVSLAVSVLPHGAVVERGQPARAHAASGGVIRGLTLQGGLVQNVNVGLVQPTDLQPTGLNAATYGSASHIPYLTIDAGGRLAALQQTPMVVVDQGGQCFNVAADAYGASPANTDNSSAFQSAINAAIAAGGGEVLVPTATSGYIFKSTLNINCTGFSGIRITGIGSGFASLSYQGPSGTPAFIVTNANYAIFDHVNISLGGTGTTGNNIGWDIQYPANTQMSLARWSNCNVQMQGTLGGHIGWRIGQGPGGSSSSAVVWDQCNVQSSTNTWTDIGWQFGGSQNDGMSLRDCGFAGLGAVVWNDAIKSHLSAGCLAGDTTITVARAQFFPQTGGTIQFPDTGEEATYTGVSFSTNQLTGLTRGVNGTTAAGHSANAVVNQYVTSQGVYPGGKNWTWQRGVGSGVSIFAHQNASDCEVNGLYVEGGGSAPANGVRLLEIGDPGSGGSSSSCNVVLKRVTAAGIYVPGDGLGNIFLSQNCQFSMDDCNITASSGTFGSTFLYTGGNQSNGGVSVRGGTLQATWPFIANHQNWAYDVFQLNLLDAGLTPNYVANQRYLPVVAVTDGSTVTVDLSRGTRFSLAMGSALSNRTVNFSNAVPGQKFSLYLQQPSSSGPDTVTWGTTGIRWQGGSAPTLTTTNGKIDVIDFEVEASGVYVATPRLNY